MELDQLWKQFQTEARAGYELYSQDVDWAAREKEKGIARAARIVRDVFWALLMKLSPARRVLLLLALVLVAFGRFGFRAGDSDAHIDMRGWGILILLLLLALELADRVVMKRDLEIAREIQRSLVPAKPPETPGLELAFTTRPANTVAGDYYDAFFRNGNSGEQDASRLLLVVADVAGKSVPAALLMATFQASLQALAALPGSLAELVGRLNLYACAHSLGGLRFTTAFLAEYDVASGALGYINAGHNAPCLRRAGSRIERLETGGLPLGIEPGATHASASVALTPGDLLVVFTDGMIEAVSESGEEFGEHRLGELLRSTDSAAAESAEKILRQLMSAVDSFVGTARQHDDITCLVMRAVSSGQPRSEN
jgi:sigma-B regulation protein RsbU (phosphoserine phosphatase)